MDLNFWTALSAGFITFFTPCVLPLIPVYISLITGISIEELKAGVGSKKLAQIAFKILAFILGFTLIFVALGATGAAIGQFLIRFKFYLVRAAGLLMIIFGLYLLGVFKISIFNNVFRLNVQAKKSSSLISAFLFGILFGFAWSPCSGPVLGAIIMMASTTANVSKGAFYLFAYSMGIAIPLFISGVGFTYFLEFFSRFKKVIGYVDKAAGALLVLVGVMYFAGFQHLLYF